MFTGKAKGLLRGCLVGLMEGVKNVYLTVRLKLGYFRCLRVFNDFCKGLGTEGERAKEVLGKPGQVVVKLLMLLLSSWLVSKHWLLCRDQSAGQTVVCLPPRWIA